MRSVSGRPVRGAPRKTITLTLTILNVDFCIFGSVFLYFFPEKCFGCGGGGGGTVGAKTLTHTPPWETAQIKQLRSDLPANMIWSR